MVGQLAQLFRRFHRLVGFVFVAALALSLLENSSTAHAQRRNPRPRQDRASDPLREAALINFQAGLDAIQQENWPLAYDCFRRADASYPTASIVVNLALAERQTNRLVESRATYQRYLEMTRARPDEAMRADVERMLRELEEDIPRITVFVRGLLPGDVFLLDGVAREASRDAMPVNPGRHSLEIRRDDRIVARASIEVGTGAVGETMLRAPPRAVQTGAPSSGNSAGNAGATER